MSVQDLSISLECSKCGKPLSFLYPTITSLGAIRLRVEPCNNMDCYDCSKCEDTLKLKNSELKTRNKELKTKLSKIAGQAIS